MSHFEGYLHRTEREKHSDNISGKSAHISPEEHDVWRGKLPETLIFQTKQIRVLRKFATLGKENRLVS